MKQLDRHGTKANKEFLAEVMMLSLLRHPNLVELIGYCADGDQRILVYQYMEMGSVTNHLHGNFLLFLALFWFLCNLLLAVLDFDYVAPPSSMSL